MSRWCKANYDPSAVSKLLGATSPSTALGQFAKARPLLCYKEVPLTFRERVKTYIPWSWSRNHKTKWIYNGPPTIKFNRAVPIPSELIDRMTRISEAIDENERREAPRGANE